MRPKISRRSFLAGIAALAASAWSPIRSKAQTCKTRLILLGTGGGPRPRKANSASAQVIVANEIAYVEDRNEVSRLKNGVFGSQAFRPNRTAFSGR